MKKTFFIFFILSILIFACGCLDNNENSQTADSSPPKGAKLIRGDETPSSPFSPPEIDEMEKNKNNFSDREREMAGWRNNSMNATNMRPRPGWNDTKRGNAANMRPRPDWNDTERGNMSDRFLDIKERLGLPDNASEDEVQETFRKMREQRNA